MATALIRHLGRQGLIGKHRSVICLTKSCGPMSTQQAYQQMEEFWKKNRRLNRPLSPHLRIYKPELPMMTSLAHRVTGIAMALTVSGASIFFFAMPGDFTHYLNLVQSLEIGPALIIAAKYLLTIPLTWHYINGIRHLSWDWAWGFALPKLYQTAYFAIILTFVASSVLVFGFK